MTGGIGAGSTEKTLKGSDSSWTETKSTEPLRRAKPNARMGFDPVVTTNGEIMSREKPTDDPRERTDKRSFRQTEEPWKKPVEKEQDTGARRSDLEKWRETDTH